jgi:hypothetical protein
MNEPYWKSITACYQKFFLVPRVQENFDKREKKALITFPLRHFFPLKVVPLIEVLLYC